MIRKGQSHWTDRWNLVVSTGQLTHVLELGTSGGKITLFSNMFNIYFLNSTSNMFGVFGINIFAPFCTVNIYTKGTKR